MIWIKPKDRIQYRSEDFTAQLAFLLKPICSRAHRFIRVAVAQRDEDVAKLINADQHVQDAALQFAGHVSTGNSASMSAYPVGMGRVPA